MLVAILVGLAALGFLLYSRLLANLIRLARRPFRPAWVRLELDGPLPSRPVLRRSLFVGPAPLSLAELSVLAQALGRDPRLRGVLIVLRQVPAGWARLESLRDIVAGLGAAGKHVAVHMSGGDLARLGVASAAKHVFVDESAPLMIHGLAAEVTFWGGTLEKIGVRAELSQRGAYKSFAETYTRKDMSPAHREAAEAILAEAVAKIGAWISRGRGVDAEGADRLVTGGPYPPAVAKAIGLVDDVAYLDEVPARWRARLPAADAATLPDEVPSVRAWQASRPRPLRGVFGLGRPRRPVAVLSLHGAIVDGDGGGLGRGLLAAGPAVRALEHLREDRRIRAVVLHVDSRGGSAPASDLMWHAAQRLGQKKPVVAYFDDVAASGGYYLACGAAGIVARSGTLTGSIGVVSGKFSAEALATRLGVHVEVLAHGEAAAMHSPWRPFSLEARRRLEAEIDAMYQQFVHKVASGRKRSEAAIDAVAQGRVWTGAAAVAHGLVDRVGGVDEAVAWARELAGLGPAARIGHGVVDVRPRPRRAGLQTMFGASLRARLRLGIPGTAVALPAELAAALPIARAAERAASGPIAEAAGLGVAMAGADLWAIAPIDVTVRG